MTSLDAVVLLIKTYTALTDEGIEISRLRELEDELGAMQSLRAEDFEAVREKWTRRQGPPSLDELMSDLRVRNNDEGARQVH